MSVLSLESTTIPNYPQLSSGRVAVLISRNLSENTNFVREKSIASHCVKSIRIRSYSGPHFLAFELNTVSLLIQSEYGKMLTRITPNTDTFHAVLKIREHYVCSLFGFTETNKAYVK